MVVMEQIDSLPERIVVGIDGSDLSIAALRWAGEEAVLRDATLLIVSAWSMPVLAYPAGPTGVFLDSGPFETEARRLVEDAVTRLRSDLGDRAVRVETSVVCERAASAILERSEDASLVVIGSRGRGGFASLVLGSVAVACIHHCRVPVVVIHEAGYLPGCGDVVVGIDDSAGARAALRWAAIEAVRLGRRLVVVHGWELPDTMPQGSAGYGPLVEDSFTEVGERLLEVTVMKELADLAERPEILTRAVPVDAVGALLAEAEDAGLLVVGSRGRGGFTGLLLGSVSQQCVHHATCPVVVVPEQSA